MKNTDSAASEAARILGGIKTEKKARASRINGLSGGRKSEANAHPKETPKDDKAGLGGGETGDGGEIEGAQADAADGQKGAGVGDLSGGTEDAV